jgi:hypothetical protein
MDFNNLDKDSISEAYQMLSDTDIRHGKLLWYRNELLRLDEYKYNSYL